MATIVIKEIFGSDVISEFMEKVNFNFDQILQAGGGPPGRIGDTGPSGGIGPIGERGSEWIAGTGITGITGMLDGTNVQAGDHGLDIFGNVFSYIEATGASGWTFSGVNLMGVTGAAGNTGGSYEFRLFHGTTGTVGSPTDGFGPTSGAPSLAQSANVDFISPASPRKVGIFLGDNIWYQDRVVAFNTYPSSTNQLNVPKLALIQEQVDFAGTNGLVFGSVGLTSGNNLTGIPISSLETANVDAYDFIQMGFVREAVLNEYQRFRINSYRMPMKIKVGGDDTHYANADFEIESSSSLFTNYDLTRFIKSKSESMNFVARDQSYIDINATPFQLNTNSGTGGSAGYIALQNVAGSITIPSFEHGFGQVFIGPTATITGSLFGLANASPAALVISRPNQTIDGNIDSSIKFYSPINLVSVNDFTAKMVASYGGASGHAFQLSSSRIGLNARFDSNSEVHYPRFPVHISSGLENLTAYTNMWPGASASSEIPEKWIFGVDSWNVGTTGPRFQGKGLGVAYSTTDPILGQDRELVLQTYYTGARKTLDSNLNPHLSIAIGNEETHGNVLLGFIARKTGIVGQIIPKSKLSIVGSVRIGPIENFLDTVAVGPTYGLVLQGSMIQGTAGFGLAQHWNTDIYSASGITGLIGASYGIYSQDRVVAKKFISTSSLVDLSDSVPSFAMSDIKSGFKGSTYGGEIYAQVGFGNANQFSLTARHSAGGETGTAFNRPGFQILGTFAEKPLYHTADSFSAAAQNIAGPGGASDYALIEITPSRSVIIFHGSGWDAASGLMWKDIACNNLSIDPNNATFIVDILPGYYDGQVLELICAGWGYPGASPASLDPSFVLRNNPYYQFPNPVANQRCLLGKEYNNGGFGLVNGDLNVTPQGYRHGLPYPFPHGADLNIAEPLTGTLWSNEGQITMNGFKTIKLRWMKYLTDASPSQNKWRWIEVSRTHVSQDWSITSPYPGYPDRS